MITKGIYNLILPELYRILSVTYLPEEWELQSSIAHVRLTITSTDRPFSMGVSKSLISVLNIENT